MNESLVLEEFVRIAKSIYDRGLPSGSRNVAQG